MIDKTKKTLNIVLIQPEIPNNTGNIGRTCVGVNASLHLVGKLGFEINDKQLRRAGLDYWKFLEWHHHADWDAWWKLIDDASRVFFFSKKTQHSLFDTEFQQGDWLVFGCETRGLDEELIEKYADQTLQIPMFGPIRSLNLSNAVAVATYEAIRQIGEL